MRTGRFDLENLGPQNVIGYYRDIQHNGKTLHAICIWKWYIGIEF